MQPMFHRYIGWGLLAGLLIVALLTPTVQARMWLNRALLWRLHRNDQQAVVAFARSLALDPNNVHARWQTSMALAASGDTEGAFATLSPLAQRRPLDPQITQLMLVLFFATGRDQAAVEFYETLDPKPVVPSGIAARLTNRFLLSSGTAPPALARQLLREVFALNMSLSDNQVYEQLWQTNGFWSTEFGQRTQAALAWRSQPISSRTAVALEGDVDPVQVAAMLGTTPDAVRLGAELVINGSFEQGILAEDRPLGWWPAFETTGILNPAAFVMGTDSEHAWGQGRSLRIDGIHEQRLSNRYPARAGYAHAPITLKGQTPYVISFVYRTERTTEPTASVWLTFDSQVVSKNHRLLPATNGRWQRVIIVGWNRGASDAIISPTLQQWSEGSAWFDDFSIKPILLDTPVPPQDALIQIVDVEGT